MTSKKLPPPPENIHSLAGLYPPGKPRDPSKPYIGFAENRTLGYVFFKTRIILERFFEIFSLK